VRPAFSQVVDPSELDDGGTVSFWTTEYETDEVPTLADRLRSRELSDQRTPTCEEEPSLLGG
jgi:hypothetical protein